MVTGFWRGPAGSGGGGSLPAGEPGQFVGYDVDGNPVAVDAPAGQQGADGADAYEVAVAAGFVGTRTEWLASMKGEDGTDGEDGVSPDVRSFATYADALAYSTANPAAIVFSEEEAP